MKIWKMRHFAKAKCLLYKNLAHLIKNFYPSMYTHSIPWVLVGKAEAKKEKNIIESFPFSVEEDIDDIFSFIKVRKERLRNDNKLSISKEKRILYNLIDFSILREKQGKKGSLKLLFKSLKETYNNEEISKDAWKCKIWEELINVVLMRPQLSNYFLELVNVIDDKELLINIKDEIQNKKGTKLDKFYKNIIGNNISFFLY